MKSYSFSIIAAILMTAALAVMTGCEYDAAQPLWYEDFQASPSPRITQIDPDQATAGVNTITIRGENFAGASGTNDVYFDVVPAEIVSSSATSITVRRPNYVTDSSTVKVVSDQALLVAKFDKPYKIAPVVKLHGNYPENLRISAVAVDQAENAYAVMFTSKDILQITPDGQTTVIARATRAPTDSRTGPDGRIYFPGNNRSIDVLDVSTKTITTWLQFPTANPQKFVKFGDFDASGYFYTGGTRTDLMIVAPDLSTRAAGFYPTTAGSANNDILAVRVYNGYVYVATKTTATGPATIWRHSIGAGGTLGAQEMVL
ncbi:MAG: IPT/TIG domain-containing protein, partial [Anaerolineae bacterium]|nr:IPT/TIG domain-containing protein [Anaerolineae bacterium]